MPFTRIYQDTLKTYLFIFRTLGLLALYGMDFQWHWWKLCHRIKINPAPLSPRPVISPAPFLPGAGKHADVLVLVRGRESPLARYLTPHPRVGPTVHDIVECRGQISGEPRIGA